MFASLLWPIVKTRIKACLTREIKNVLKILLNKYIYFPTTSSSTPGLKYEYNKSSNKLTREAWKQNGICHLCWLISEFIHIFLNYLDILNTWICYFGGYRFTENVQKFVLVFRHLGLITSNPRWALVFYEKIRN